MNRRKGIYQLYEFQMLIEDLIDKKIQGNFPTDWDEDFITRDLLRDLRRIGKMALHIDLKLERPFPTPWPVQISLHENTINLAWGAYKLTGKREQHFGDVAVIVHTRYHDGTLVEGVAFLEAKKRELRSTRYRSISDEQLGRILKYAPKASVLLYDFEPVSYIQPQRFLRTIQFTYAVTVPMDIVYSTKKKDTSLYKFSKPLSHQLLLHLMGYDLDRSQLAMDIAKGNEDQIGSPRYILELHVGINTDVPSEIRTNYIHKDYISIDEEKLD